MVILSDIRTSDKHDIQLRKMPKCERECFLTLKHKMLFAVNPKYIFFVACLNFSENFENLHKLVAHWRKKSTLVCCNPFFYIDWVFHFPKWLNCLFRSVQSSAMRWLINIAATTSTENQSSAGGGTSLPHNGLKAISTLSHCELQIWDCFCV